MSSPIFEPPAENYIVKTTKAVENTKQRRRNMEYKKYQHIEKLGTHEVEGILNGEVHLTYKIDGTNSCVYLKNDELAFGSRNRELSLDQDNQGFVAAAMKIG
jgi:hypothetical protein